MTTKGRKTIEVKSILESVNFFLAVSDCSADRRQGQIDIIGLVLTNAQNYGGFRYLTVDEVPAGQLPGINKDADTIEAQFANTDETRVQFSLKYPQ